MIRRLSVFFAILASLTLLCVSCGPPNERAHPAFRKGENKSKAGDYKEAVASYEKYLLLNPRSALTHSRLAQIYNDNLDDPLMAIFHFRKYLEFEPESPDADTVRAWISAAEKRYAEKIRKKYPDKFTAEAELAAAKEREAKYRECVLKLRDWNAKLLREIRMGKPVKETSSISGETSTYVVRPGDTLTKISRKIYGTSKYHSLIFKANRESLKTETLLKIGQKLRIPKLPGAHDQEASRKSVSP